VRVDRVDEIFHVAGRQSAREFARMGPELQGRGGIALDDFLVHQLAGEAAQTGEMSALRADCQTSIRERFEERGQSGGVELRGRQPDLAAPRLKNAEVMRVSVHRMRAESALDGLARQMAIDQLVPAGGGHAVAPSAGFSSTFSSKAARSSRIRSR